MFKRFSAAVASFLPAVALALTPPAEPAPEEGSAVGTAIFLVVFLLICIGYVYMTWRNERKSKQQNREEQKQ